MTAFTYTAANIRPLLPSNTEQMTADVADMTPGQLVYKKSDGDAALADANSATLVDAVGMIIAIQSGKATTAAGDVITVALPGSRIAGFSGMTPGTPGYVGETPGQLVDAAPTGAGTWTKRCDHAESATVFFLDISGEDATSNS